MTQSQSSVSPAGRAAAKRPIVRAFALLVITLGVLGVEAAELPSFTELVKAYGPAVIKISTRQAPQAGGEFFGQGELGSDPIYDYLKRFLGGEPEALEPPGDARYLGSGFIVSEDGYVLTNAHVVENSDEIFIRLGHEPDYEAEIVGVDQRSDIALLKIEPREDEELQAVKIGTAEGLEVGAWVLAIGSPFGFDHSATAGIVSAKGRILPSEDYVSFIQTDVAINPGNSGGPLFNLDGEVVGVNTNIVTDTGVFAGLSFAIPIDEAMDVVRQLKTKGRVSRGWLGVTIQELTRELAMSFQLGFPRGALVADVIPGSPARAGGIMPGDVILKFNGKDVRSSGHLPQMVAATRVGDTAEVTVWRGGRSHRLTVTIAELPDEEDIYGDVEQVEPGTVNRIGLVAVDLSPEQLKQLGVIGGGVIVESVEPGPAESAGVRAGDLILMLDGERVKSAGHFKELLDRVEPGRTVAMQIQRSDGRMFFPIGIPKP